jgi:hypothetical protein
MQKKTKTNLLTWILLVLIILTNLSINDIYYSNLQENYPILKQTEQIEGEVTDILVHHKYAYLELDSSTKRLVPPSFLKSTDPTHFHKILSIGDHFVHEANSSEVMLLKNDERLRFVVTGFLRSGDL